MNHGKQLPPITNQPVRGIGLVGSNSPGSVPPGLECLADVDQLFVKQNIELLEILFGFETKNGYHIFDNTGRANFYAKEDSDCCTRNTCGKLRPFNMKIVDKSGIEIIHLYRPFACGECCFPCCLQSIEVCSPPGSVVGGVEQEWSCIYPAYKIKDSLGNVVLRIKGPCVTTACCSNVEFIMYSADGLMEVGSISKIWSGLAREMFTDSDDFTIRFPKDLHIKMKAVMIGACMLIDFMYFEE